MTDQRQHIYPQPGFQTSFLSSSADIVIGGGAAGAGKSYALLMEPLRHAGVSNFFAVIFRRTTPQITNPGGLWDTSKELYSKLRDGSGASAKSTDQPLKWKFPSGASLLLTHLEHEKSKEAWDGAQVSFLGFDELIHFTAGQFWYLAGRNRSASSGVKPYVRATTNPQTSGWVKRLISWWIHPDDHDDHNLRGMPIPERAGVLRWFVRHNEVMYWGGSISEVQSVLPDEVKAKHDARLVKSITFIPGTLDDNTILSENDPGYEANLFAQDKKHATRLRRGCWYDAEGENELFRYEDLYDMFRNKFVEGGEAYQTADIAMEGADVFRIGTWNGLRLEKIESWEKSDGKMIWEAMERSAQQYKVFGKNIAFDTNGVGNFLKGFFKSSYDFRSQSSPIEVDGLKLNYANLRAQCAFKLSELVLGHKIYIQCEDERVQQLMIEEFEAHKKTGVNAAGKLTITPKDEVKASIRRSPDYFDMILMRMVFVIKPRKRSSLLDPPPAKDA
jgi:hypothetical protein